MAPSDMALAISNRLGLLFGPAAHLLAPVVRTAIRVGAGVDVEGLRPVDGIASAPVPIFVMTGAADKKTTVEESRAMFAKARSPKFYWEVPGAWHVDLAAIGGAAYRERLIAFLDESLPGRSREGRR